MQKYNIKTTDGAFEIQGTRYEMGKYLTIYNGEQIVFEIRASRVHEIK